MHEQPFIPTNEMRGISPQEKNMMLMQEADEAVRDFLKKDPAKIKAEELIEATTRIDSLRYMAENSGNEELPKYLDDRIAELRAHKNLGAKAKLESMGTFANVPKPNFRGKRKIGTHN